MEMPKPSDAHKKLERLTGYWEGTETMFPSPWAPKGGEATGKVRNRVALGGFNVIQEYEQESNGSVTFSGHGVFRWDDAANCYVLHWFDSMGMPPNEFRGNFDGNVLNLTSQGSMGHNRTVFDFSKSGEYTFRMQVSPDGQNWQTFMEGRYQRKGNA